MITPRVIGSSVIYVKKVRSSLKGSCDVELGQKTVIVGPNGAGKSTIVQAIELSTRGLVSDMEGREQVKLHTALARLFPSDAEMFAECSLSDGTKFSWSMEAKKGGGFKEPVLLAPRQVRWPVQDLRDVLRGDHNKVASWLEQQVLGEMEEDEVLRLLDPDIREPVRALIKKERHTDLLKLAKAAKDTAKTLRAGATRAEKTIESLIEGVAPPLLPADRTRLEAELTGLSAPSSGEVTPEVHEQAKAEISRRVDALIALHDEAAKLGQAVDASADAHKVERLLRIRQFITEYRQHFGTSSGCAVCLQGSADDIATAEQLYERLIEQLSGLVRAHREAAKVKARVKTAEEELKTLAESFKAMKVQAPRDEERRNQLIRQLATDDQSNRTWRNVQAQRQEAKADRARATALSEAAKALVLAGKQVLDSRKQSFVDRVNAFLPPGDKLGVDLDSGRFGFVRGGQLHSALSGAEWSRVLLALASVGLDGSTPSILVPEDRAWDRDTLARVMDALRDAPGQVLIMSTIKPEPVSGWLIVEAGS